MKAFRSPFLAALTALALLAGAVPATQAHSPLGEAVDAASGSLTADDTGTAFLIRYIGPAVSGVATVASGTITLEAGAAGSEPVDTTIECPLAAPFAGVLDLTNAACDTVGELADVVNSTAGSKWRIVPVGSLRSDITNARLLAVTDAKANSPGASIFWDTSTAFNTTLVLGAGSQSTVKYEDFFTVEGRAKPQPFFGQMVQALAVTATSTFGSGTSNLQVFSVKQAWDPNRNTYSEVATLLYQEAGGATTVQKNFNFNSGSGLFGYKDEKVIVRLNNSLAQSAILLAANGLLYRRR